MWSNLLLLVAVAEETSAFGIDPRLYLEGILFSGSLPMYFSYLGLI